MAEYKDCYVAFFDVLGFKNLLTKVSCDEILALFEKAKQVGYWTHRTESDGLTSTNKENATPIVDPNEINIKIMSDSICIFIEAQVPNALLGLISTCTSYQANMLALPKPVLLRGGISRGDLYYDGNIIFGGGLTAAYLLESKNAKFPRVILTKRLFDDCNYDDEKLKDFARSMLIDDFDAFYSLNYFMEFCWLSATSRQEEIENVHKHIQSVLAETTDESVRAKYLYLNDKFQYYYKTMKEKLGENHA